MVSLTAKYGFGALPRMATLTSERKHQRVFGPFGEPYAVSAYPADQPGSSGHPRHRSFKRLLWP